MSSTPNHSVRTLQQMLRILARDDNRLAYVKPDGIYGPQTKLAVEVFQRQHHLPVTGTADQQTWDAIVTACDDAAVRVLPAQAIRPFIPSGHIYHRQDTCANIHLSQAMLEALAAHFPNHPCPTHSGCLDENTTTALSCFQHVCGLPETGDLDRHTWRMLAMVYSCLSAQDAEQL